MDTPLVNGTAYPYLTVQRKAYRFRILNATNDRFLNLQIYYADPSYKTSFRAGSPALPGFGTEVKMVPAVANPNWPANWPTDNRAGGVPEPTLAGPDIVQYGTEGGILPNPAVIPSTPVGYRIQPPQHRRAERQHPRTAYGTGRAGGRGRRFLQGSRGLPAHPL